MGISDEKIFRLTFLCVLFLAGTVLFGQGTGTSAILENFVLPEYRDNGKKLQFILYGKKAENLGAFIYLTNPILDIVKSNVTDIMQIKPVLNQPLYPFGASEQEIRDFWERYPHSHAFITSEKAQYDKNTRILRGDSVAILRSREMDIRGTGFEAEQRRKFIHIRKDVTVIVRAAARRKAEGASSNTKNNTKGSK